jgi:hypothetical protein
LESRFSWLLGRKEILTFLYCKSKKYTMFAW